MYATLPSKSKPSKCVSKDQKRTVLARAELRERKPGEWEIVATDSYKLARIPLHVRHTNADGEIVAGEISADALKAIEKTGSFTANGTITPCNHHGVATGPQFPRSTDPGTFPNVEQVMPANEPHSFTIGLNARYLADLAAAMGSDAVSITFQNERDGSKPDPTRPMVVKPLNGAGDGVLMPIRLNR